MYLSTTGILRAWDHVPSFLLWTHIPNGLERAYWASANTRARVLSDDKAMLICDIVGRLFLQLAFYLRGSTALIIVGSTIMQLITQVIQLTWLLLLHSIYYKHRSWINMFSRGRHMVLAVLLVRHRSAEEYAETFLTRTYASHKGSWRALFILLAGPGILQSMGAISHQLSFKPFLSVTLCFLWIYIINTLPLLLELLDAMQVRDLLHIFCSRTHLALSFPWTLADSSSSTPQHCAPGAEPMLLVFIHLQISTVIPLVVTCMRERASKATFLQQAGIHESRLVTCTAQQRYSTKQGFLWLSTWACVSLQWSASVCVYMAVSKLKAA